MYAATEVLLHTAWGLKLLYNPDISTHINALLNWQNPFRYWSSFIFRDRTETELQGYLCKCHFLQQETLMHH